MRRRRRIGRGKGTERSFGRTLGVQTAAAADDDDDAATPAPAPAPPPPPPTTPAAAPADNVQTFISEVNTDNATPTNDDA